MRVVRFGVFETASSSVHSVTIGSKDRSRWVKEHRRLFHVPGEIRIEGGEFGWGPETHDDAYTKASYAWTYLLETDQSSGPLRDMLERVLLQGPGVEVVNLVEPERDRYGMGCYIRERSQRMPACQHGCPNCGWPHVPPWWYRYPYHPPHPPYEPVWVTTTTSDTAGVPRPSVTRGRPRLPGCARFRGRGHPGRVRVGQLRAGDRQ